MMNRLITAVTAVAAMACLGGAVTTTAQDAAGLTPKTLQAALEAKPSGAEADRLATRIREYFGGAEALAMGGAAKIDDVLVAFALEAPPQEGAGPPPRVVSDAVLFTMPLTRVGTSNVYAGVAQLAHGTAFTWHYEIGPRRMGGGQLEAYETHPDSLPQPGVPKGTVKQMPPWESKIFAAPNATGGSMCRRSTPTPHPPR